jgi:hypothetical protein
MSPAPVTHCRVLELGAAGGGNLIPMADAPAGSQFVGLDYSARQIEWGRAAVDALGLKNLSLRHMNILDMTPEFGQFDYIIAHGIYSWVPTEVRDRLLAVCNQNLAPNLDRVTNLNHQRVKLDPLGAFLLPQLDGKHDREALLQLVIDGPVTKGMLKLEHAGQPVRDRQQLRAMLFEVIERLLRWFAFAAVLVG